MADDDETYKAYDDCQMKMFRLIQTTAVLLSIAVAVITTTTIKLPLPLPSITTSYDPHQQPGISDDALDGAGAAEG